MRFAIAQEVSGLAVENGLQNLVHSMSEILEEFLADKSYGPGVDTFYIGIICVAPEFDFFFKVRKPKYKKGKLIWVVDNSDNVAANLVEYDLKLVYEDFVVPNEDLFKKIIKENIINSFEVLKTMKIPFFDKDRFVLDLVSKIQSL